MLMAVLLEGSNGVLLDLFRHERRRGKDAGASRGRLPARGAACCSGWARPCPLPRG